MGVALHPDLHAVRTIDRLRSLWGSLGGPGRNGCPVPQIAGSVQDQRTPDGRRNPLWEIVRWMPAEESWRQPGVLEPEGTTWVINFAGAQEDDPGRNGLSSRYTWSIISPGDVDWIVEQLDGKAVVEIGAGTGYWAWQLEQAGIDVAAYDPHPPAPDNKYCKHGPYASVAVGGPEAVTPHPDRALLMVWPPYGGGHAEEALRAYQGDALLYAGEGWGGCTADDGFYELLDAEWVETSVSERHVSWSGIHCQLSAFRRKSEG